MEMSSNKCNFGGFALAVFANCTEVQWHLFCEVENVLLTYTSMAKNHSTHHAIT